jgi:hypothetical protein
MNEANLIKMFCDKMRERKREREKGGGGAG